jgi:hypothetical protein
MLLEIEQRREHLDAAALGEAATDGVHTAAAAADSHH